MLRFFWKSPGGAVRASDDIAGLALPCPACDAADLDPLGPEDRGPPSVRNDDLPRLFVCGACDALVVARAHVRAAGYEIRLGGARIPGPMRPQIAAMIRVVSRQTHHPWRVLLERERRLPDHRLDELPDLRKALGTAGEMGGGRACPGCGRKPLAPEPDPGIESAFETRTRVLFPCGGCGETWVGRYEFDGGGVPDPELTRAAPAPGYWAAYRALEGEDLDAYVAAVPGLAALPGPENPGVARLVAAGRAAAGAEPPPAALGDEPRKPLLRRLAARSPLFGQRSWTVTAAVSPRLRMSGSVLKTLVDDLTRKASKQGAAKTLTQIADWNLLHPYLVKTPPIQRVLAEALVDLRRRLREAGDRLVPLACADGVYLIDPASGERRFRLPHMQAAAEAPPVALGFTNRMVYYQEPGELAITGHPLVEGGAWRTRLDGAARRWIDLGRYTVVETEAGLCELSGSSGRVRWARARKALGGLEDWTVSGGMIVAAGAETLFVLDPATGAVTREDALPKRARRLALVHGDLPPPAAIVDQGYGPGIFAPAAAEVKGVKPIAGPAEGGAEQLAYVTCRRETVVSLWESEFGYAERAVSAGPLEKKFAARSCLVETALAEGAGVTLRDGGRLAVVPGSPTAVVDLEAGALLHSIEVDSRRGLREVGPHLLALGTDQVAGLDAARGEVTWRLATPDLQAVDIPGPQLTPPPRRPGAPPPADPGPPPPTAEEEEAP